MTSQINDDPVGDTTMETTHLAGPPVRIEGVKAGTGIFSSCVPIAIARHITDLNTTTIQVVPHPQTLKDEITRLRAELIDVKQTASAAAADTAVARMALRMAVDQHDREAKEMKRTIAGLFSAITAQTQDLERLAAAVVAREYAAPAKDVAPDRTDADDWSMPGGLPRGVR